MAFRLLKTDDKVTRVIELYPAEDVKEFRKYRRQIVGEINRLLENGFNYKKLQWIERILKGN